MIQTAILYSKIPVLQTSILNKSAIKLYESLNFIKVYDYAFEFI